VDLHNCVVCYSLRPVTSAVCLKYIWSLFQSCIIIFVWLCDNFRLDMCWNFMKIWMYFFFNMLQKLCMGVPIVWGEHDCGKVKVSCIAWAKVTLYSLMICCDRVVCCMTMPYTHFYSHWLCCWLTSQPSPAFFSRSQAVCVYKERNIKQSTNVQEIVKGCTVVAYLSEIH
jgi:hypothetical protein